MYSKKVNTHEHSLIPRLSACSLGTRLTQTWLGEVVQACSCLFHFMKKRIELGQAQLCVCVWEGEGVEDGCGLSEVREDGC